jgi:DNA-directed RNA polymerase subunit RPC12/RpoP
MGRRESAASRRGAVVSGFDERRSAIAAGGKAVACPYCGSADTRRTAEFGPFHMTEQYHCLACRSPFSLLKWEGADDPDPRAPRA